MTKYKKSYFTYLCLLPKLLQALPQDPHVLSGEALFLPQDSASIQIQVTDHAIIEYKKFDIDVGQSVQFVQPSSASVVLNRVIGKDPSHILGALTSNGKVFLVNESGIYFGKESAVNVGALVASTMDVGNTEFCLDHFSFEQGPDFAQIINQGCLQAEQDVILLSPDTVNQGRIIAKTGTVLCASGEKVLLDFMADGLISFFVAKDLPCSKIVQEGVIDALSGQVILSVNAAKQVIEDVINIEGIDLGLFLEEKDGSIFLASGSKTNALQISGEGKKIAIEGDLLAVNGGSIKLAGKDVSIEKGVLRVESTNTGGDISIEAEKILLGEDARVFASNGNFGSGGRVSLYAKEDLCFDGYIEARGESIGGIVEMKSLGSFTAKGLVHAGSIKGSLGSWHLSSMPTEAFQIEQAEAHIVISAIEDLHLDRSFHLQKEGAGLTLQAGGIIRAHRGEISTQGGKIAIKSPMQLEGARDFSFSAVRGNVYLEKEVEGSKDANLTITGKEIHVFQEIGRKSPLGSLEFHGEKLFLQQSLTTHGKDISFHTPVFLLQDIAIDTTASGSVERGADIRFFNKLSGNYRVHLNAGEKGEVLLNNGMGVGGAPLAAAIMKAGTIHIGDHIRADGGTVICYGNVVISSSIEINDTGPTGIVFHGSINSDGAPYDLTLVAPIGQVIFLGDIGDISPLCNLHVSSSSIQMKNSIETTQSASFIGPVTLQGDIVITSPAIAFSKTIDGRHDFHLDAGPTGSIVLESRVGGITRLQNMRIINAATFTSQDIYSATFEQSAGSGTSTWNGVLDTNLKGGVILTGNSFVLNDGVKTMNSGSFTVANTGSFVDLGNISLSGSFTQTGPGIVQLGGNISTNNRDISIESGVVLTSNIVLSTGSVGTGSISFDSSIDGAYSLTLSAGGGNIAFSDAIGLITPLKDVVITSVQNTTASSSIRSNSFSQLQGTGRAFYGSSITTRDIMGISLTSNELMLAGRDSGQILKTLGTGNIVLNSVYYGLGSEANPVELSILGGQGTAFEGSGGTVYFASALDEVGHICTIRSNPGCQVFYSKNGQPYEDFTPGYCCSHDPIPPPPPPPAPPSPSSSSTKKPLVFTLLYYVPGIYTDYWQFKDTLGASWYFNLDFLESLSVMPPRTLCPLNAVGQMKMGCLIYGGASQIDTSFATALALPESSAGISLEGILQMNFAKKDKEYFLSGNSFTSPSNIVKKNPFTEFIKGTQKLWEKVIAASAALFLFFVGMHFLRKKK
jgi:filamentous hemagglutinin family protein